MIHLKKIINKQIIDSTLQINKKIIIRIMKYQIKRKIYLFKFKSKRNKKYLKKAKRRTLLDFLNRILKRTRYAFKIMKNQVKK